MKDRGGVSSPGVELRDLIRREAVRQASTFDQVLLGEVSDAGDGLTVGLLLDGFSGGEIDATWCTSDLATVGDRVVVLSLKGGQSFFVVGVVGATIAGNDHGSLSGLGDDDHTQYHTDTRADTWHAGLAGAHVTNGDSHNHAGGDGAQIDHGGLDGLADDDHSQYHTDGRAATWHAGLSGSHVTNGDSHDHAGGDGAQIAHSGLSGATSSPHVTNGDAHDHAGGDGAQIAHSSLSGATSSPHVTNGDSHDHAGGDGAQIDHGGLAGLSDVADHLQYARGQLAYAEVTANQGSLTTDADLTGLSVTFTPAANRRIRVTGVVIAWQRTANPAIGDRISLDINEGGTLLQRASVPWETAGGSGLSAFCIVQRVLTPSAAEHTYKLVYHRISGAATISMRASATEPCFILVEDIGPA